MKRIYIVFILLIMAFIAAGCVKSDMYSETTVSYKVGDYYPDPDVTFSAPGVVATGTMPTGVVFWLDADHMVSATHGTHGKIVALDDCIDRVGEDQVEGLLSWSNYTIMAHIEVGASSETDGLANMISVADYIAENSDMDVTWGTFPAFEYVNGLNNAHADYAAASQLYSASRNPYGVWYIPSIAELQHLLCGACGEAPENWSFNQVEYGDHYPSFVESGYTLDGYMTWFNDILEAAGGVELLRLDRWWSSTERYEGGGYAWGIDFYDGYSDYVHRDSGRVVRAVANF